MIVHDDWMEAKTEKAEECQMIAHGAYQMVGKIEKPGSWEAVTVHGEWMVGKTERVEHHNRTIHGKHYQGVDWDTCWRAVIVHDE